ncbi:MAG: hypothetical protein JWR55_846 [Aeromicrobium sp.]|jgi:hypothetical protein|nr:hypothetical protein [Aeromicrobium sp.]
MLDLAWTMARAGGWARWALLAGCTAAVSGLLLVAVALLLLGDANDESLASFVRDGGTRGGVAFAVLLLTLPPLLLLDQAVRLGSVHRDRRLAALRVAGATPSEVRRLGAIEVGIPTSVGAVLGIGVFEVLGAVLGGQAYDPNAYYGSSFAVVPTSGPPHAWHMVVVVLAVAVAGTSVGWWASRTVLASPLGVTRRESRPAPRPWGFLLVLAAVLMIPPALDESGGTTFLPFVAIGLVVLAPVTLAPWVAHAVARRVAARTDRASSLLAAQRIIAAPGAAGRAAAAIGGIALVGGGVVGFYLDVRGNEDSTYAAGAILVAAALLVGLAVAAGSMAVHSVESLLDRRREVAFLAASGMLESELQAAARREITMVALPLAVVGSAAGAVTVPLLDGPQVGDVVLALVLGVGVVTTLIWVASALAVRAVRPWARRASSPLNLRTE